MAAPHGACNEEMAEALSKTGFEAACISRSSLMARNPAVKWPLSVGLRPAEFFGGLPAIPRFHIQSDVRTRARLAAFLGQAVVPIGHHGDLARGIDLLRNQAGLINSMADVAWGNMQSISESNYWMRHCGDVLHVRMYSRAIRLSVPGGVCRLFVDRPWLAYDDDEPLQIDGVVPSPASPGLLVAVKPGAIITVRSRCKEAVDPHTVPAPPFAPGALFRRYLCEVRDRLRPAVDMILRRAAT
jgi:hypothetical protein